MRYSAQLCVHRSTLYNLPVAIVDLANSSIDMVSLAAYSKETNIGHSRYEGVSYQPILIETRRVQISTT